jgi:hypothetical protein
MGFNRLREMWLSNEDMDQGFLFGESEPEEPESEPEPVVRRKRPPREDSARTRRPPVVEPTFLPDGIGEQLASLLNKCMECVERDPEVALNGRPVEWESWFSQPILSTLRRANLPTGLKQRLLAFFALMLPFLDEREQERVQANLVTIVSGDINEFGEILTEQDLIQAQWLVQAIRKSKDVLSQMQGLRRSVLRSIPIAPLV